MKSLTLKTGKLCVTCGHEKTVQSREPDDWVRWRLGPFEIRLWRWRDVLLCDECDIDRSEEKAMDGALDIAYEDGRRKGWQEATEQSKGRALW